jgi:hypothetical protein
VRERRKTNVGARTKENREGWKEGRKEEKGEREGGEGGGSERERSGTRKPRAGGYRQHLLSRMIHRDRKCQEQQAGRPKEGKEKHEEKVRERTEEGEDERAGRDNARWPGRQDVLLMIPPLSISFRSAMVYSGIHILLCVVIVVGDSFLPTRPPPLRHPPPRKL